MHASHLPRPGGARGLSYALKAAREDDSIHVGEPISMLEVVVEAGGEYWACGCAVQQPSHRSTEHPPQLATVDPSREARAP